MKLLIKYLYPKRGFIAATFTIKMLSTLVELAIPYILSYILDDVIPLGRIGPILYWGGLMIVCAVLTLVGNTAANRMVAKTARNMTEAVRHDLFEKTMRMTCQSSDRLTIPSLESRLTSDTYNLHHFVGMVQRIGVRAPLLLIGGIIITLILDARLAVVMLAILPILFAVIFLVTKYGIPLFFFQKKFPRILFTAKIRSLHSFIPVNPGRKYPDTPPAMLTGSPTDERKFQ